MTSTPGHVPHARRRPLVWRWPRPRLWPWPSSRTGRRSDAVPMRALGVVAAGAVLLAGFGAPARGVSAQYDVLDDWRTYANGDEVLAVEVNPADPDEVWVGTEGGGVVVWSIDRSSGAPRGDFTQYLFPNEPGLASNTVHDIAFDPTGDEVWIATSLGLSRVSGPSWEVVDLEDALPGVDVVNAVAVDASGQVWIGTPGDGLAMRDTYGDWVFVEPDDLALDAEEAREGPGAREVWDIAVDADDRVWVVHGRQSAEVPVASIFDPEHDPDDGQWRHIISSGPTADVDPITLEVEAPRTSSITAVAADLDTGDVWLASWGRGAYRFSDGEWFEYSDSSSSDPEYDPPCSDTLWAVDARGGDAWVACSASSGASERGAGVAAWSGSDSWSLVTLTHGLPTNIVTSLGIADGWTFLGTDSSTNGTVFTGNGVVPVRFDATGSSEVAAALTTGGVTPQANEITAIAFDPGGRLWAGTRGAGVLRWDGDGSGWEQFTFDGTDRDLAGDTISDFALRGDELWISATSVVRSGSTHVDGGVSVYDLTTDTWVATHRPVPDTAENGQISSLSVLGDGRVAMGIGSATGGVGIFSQNGMGVAIYDPDSDDWEFHDFELTDGALSGNTILDLDNDGHDLWAAVSYFSDPRNASRRTGGGVSRFSGSLWTSWGVGDDGFETIEDGLITGDTRSIYVDSLGDVWAGTYDTDSVVGSWPLVDAVVNRWSRSRAEWEAEVFPAEGWVSALVEDSEGMLWAGTSRGHLEEVWPARGILSTSTADSKTVDHGEGGIFVYDGGEWANVGPRTSGLAFKAITALAVEPSTGYVWVGGESGGFSVYQVGNPSGPTRTPRPTDTPGPSPTPGPPATATVPPVFTLPPSTATRDLDPIDATRSPVPGSTQAPGADPDEPSPPPEVPEASTWLLLLIGLGATWWWMRRRGGALRAAGRGLGID